MTDWTRSTYLDLTSYGSYDYTSSTTVVEAYNLDPDDVSEATTQTLRMGFVLPRANEATALLDMNWADRQAELAKLKADDALWKTYGADKAAFDAMADAIEAAGGKIADTDDGYLTSAESRTVWVELDPAAFEALLGQTLMVTEDGRLFWEGALDPQVQNLMGLIVEADFHPAAQVLYDETVELEQGDQSIGNGRSAPTAARPQEIADLYNFPLTSDFAVDSTVALMEPGVGSALPSDATHTFQDLLEEYVNLMGQPGDQITSYTVAPGGQSYTEASGERSLDVGVVAAVNPYGRIGLYASPHIMYATYQLAIFDDVNDPDVMSSSFGDNAQYAPDSPFFTATQEIFIDALLANRTFFVAAGDSGSGAFVLDGTNNIFYSGSSPYVVSVGGTSLSTQGAADEDSSLVDIVVQAGIGDPTTIWNLVRGGMTSMPSSSEDGTYLIETAWNNYVLDGDTIHYLINQTGSGGVDARVEMPGYQTDYGAASTVMIAAGETGRAIPDVSAAGGGNTFYLVPAGDMDSLEPNAGTSAAAPLWAALFQQMTTLFEAQGLPRPGYVNDMLYQAAAISPAVFNDVLLGNNRSSAIPGSDYNSVDTDGNTVTFDATGQGFEAGPDFDLVSGLGTPNAELLAQTLLAIAHNQTSADAPAILDEGTGGWTIGATGTVLTQVSGKAAAEVDLTIGGTMSRIDSAATDEFAWTTRLAQQSLQDDFSAELVALFDGNAQGAVTEMAVTSGDSIGVAVDGEAASSAQGALTHDFGFVDFVNTDEHSGLRMARPVAVADTIGGQDGQSIVVSTRQGGQNDIALQIFRVDDFAGTINGLTPGEDGYAEAAARRAYLTDSGAAWVDGGGFGAHRSTTFDGVDAGDLIGMRIQTEEDVFWGFSAGNATADEDPTTHLWNYGRNTWGFEDQKDGGDRDYNDLVVGFDFAPFTDLSASDMLA
ncbi:S53 family peptidase [Chachezhania sediminis]|uniref:S53 family peptidase n=1 Tax=Chachezhania sediminis TaxID=2599291 RepID=UPI00131BC1FD|nr:S53 family peptidase [Chachezhania sediminis]